MSEKRIVTIGCELASGSVKHVSFRSKSSLLDFDIVLFTPLISDFLGHGADYFQGKPSLSDTQSFQLRECCEHWRRELKEAVAAGKTTLVFLPELTSVYIDTGERTYSGTGRNQKTTRHVAEYSNYNSIPADLKPVVANGSEMKLASSVAPPLAAFWNEFREMFTYHVLLTSEKAPAAILTRTGDKPVGAIFRNKASIGSLVLLPDIDFYPDEFVTEKNGKQVWTKKATIFADRFVAAIVQLDKALRAESDVTAEPAWASSDAYLMAPERTLRAELMAAELAVEAAQQAKEELSERLRVEGRLRGLLFEKGKPLEEAIIEALRKLGFTAEPFKDGGSEFDVVFESPEGRLIGEAEGKDNKAVNVDKLRQLQMNIHEDLLRDSVDAPAKPVLFGNSHRLSPLDQRTDPFTEKCVAAALTMNTALVSTPDLFLAVQTHVECQRADFATACRLAILSSVGQVTFPVPQLESEQRTESEVEDA
ncbi:hypothetical protein J2T41_000630 [Pseudomonas citronellolis]|uniref:hypothetical protein n=1 Tax=Pseudomonas citronellolis TaxID=53408 RepID=UPI00209D62CD|nr:hypothetical protein [Pseudomonas citronellolis]MCP1641036.1 hypothetical protein [Pseudomonas citronellolis]MCP1663954.1 hypothetical protein [Pseudomonas citronellolis]MCP1697132.1 hypothetical protein [Pseudomonas citronellolis]MCP1701234.1 hypothetical protein [Pseudomonas citronellolis]MCP1795741.1 hypothetical protein [Pseudomonas citronellolis]